MRVTVTGRVLRTVGCGCFIDRIVGLFEAEEIELASSGSVGRMSTKAGTAHVTPARVPLSDPRPPIGDLR